MFPRIHTKARGQARLFVLHSSRDRVVRGGDMGLSVRLAFSGLMALSVGGLAGWFYSADPATVARTSAKLLEAVATIVRLPTKETPPQEGTPQPSIDPLPRATAAPSSKSPIPGTQPVKAGPPRQSRNRLPQPIRHAIQRKKRRRAGVLLLMTIETWGRSNAPFSAPPPTPWQRAIANDHSRDRICPRIQSAEVCVGASLGVDDNSSSERTSWRSSQ